jgi:predicted nucleic acid-binding protein
MLLIDTNVWLELLLEQEKSNEVSSLLKKYTTDVLAISDFSLHSIGVILQKLQKNSLFKQFIEDMFDYGNVAVVSLAPLELHRVMELSRKYRVDFDDAYQSAAAEKYGLTLVSYDAHFDKTGHGRKKPSELV